MKQADFLFEEQKSRLINVKLTEAFSLKDLVLVRNDRLVLTQSSWKLIDFIIPQAWEREAGEETGNRSDARGGMTVLWWWDGKLLST